MRTRPNGADLLAAAQKLLRDQLLPELPEAQKHTALMIANAMGVAMRQLQAGEAAELEERLSLARLLHRSVIGPQGTNTGDRELGQLLRTGLADPGKPRRADVLKHLRTAVRQAVMESNPKYLA